MTNTVTDLLARYQAELRERQAQLPALKSALLDELSRRGIAIVTVTYDGEGDAGQIQEIDALTGAHETVLPPHALHTQIDDFAWQVLRAHHDGYENNDGGFGQLTIDVTSRTVVLDHNDRVVEPVNTTTEV